MKIEAQRLLMFALMMLASYLSVVLRPTIKMADQGERLSLDKMIPDSFAEWKIDRAIVPVAIDPSIQEKLNKIYNQTLARTYVGPQGERVMISIAYGGDQSDALQFHAPEVCYVAQGFQLVDTNNSTLSISEGHLPIRRLMTVQGSRNEPVTYWATIGNKSTLNSLQQKLIKLSYAFDGKIPDGFLVRISTIDQDRTRAYSLHEKFIRTMLIHMKEADRYRIARP